MIDNYDSFTWNLVQYLQELGEDVHVVRNDALDVAQIAALAPSRIVISPGPCTPNEAGVSLELIRSEEHTSELQSLMRISYAVFCLKKKNKDIVRQNVTTQCISMT